MLTYTTEQAARSPPTSGKSQAKRTAQVRFIVVVEVAPYPTCFFVFGLRGREESRKLFAGNQYNSLRFHPGSVDTDTSASMESQPQYTTISTFNPSDRLSVASSSRKKGRGMRPVCLCLNLYSASRCSWIFRYQLVLAAVLSAKLHFLITGGCRNPEIIVDGSIHKP